MIGASEVESTTGAVALGLRGFTVVRRLSPVPVSQFAP
jgi:hypothetical protein